MRLKFPLGLIITLPEEANVECELIKNLKLEGVSEILISNLPQIIL